MGSDYFNALSPPGGLTSNLPRPEIESLQFFQLNANSSKDKNVS
jgi:hypothetical protein|tara:strand:- start:14490 stop:14621 length:132 start_codon:yes stop_codon:yes gene_type:complete